MNERTALLAVCAEPAALVERSGVVVATSERLRNVLGPGAPPDALGPLIDRIAAGAARPIEFREAVLEAVREGRLFRRYASPAEPEGDDLEVLVLPQRGASPDDVLVVLRLPNRRMREQAIERRHERLALLGQMAAETAHELNNVLTTILGWSQLLALPRPGCTVEDLSEPAHRIEGGARKTQRIVSERMDIARGEDDRAAANVAAVARDAARIMAAECACRSIEVSVEVPEGLEARIRRTRLSQVLLNLLRNAVEALRRGGHVRLVGRADDGLVVLQVVDDGPGMDAATCARAFDPFFATRRGGDSSPVRVPVPFLSASLFRRWRFAVLSATLALAACSGGGAGGRAAAGETGPDGTAAAPSGSPGNDAGAPDARRTPAEVPTEEEPRPETRPGPPDGGSRFGIVPQLPEGIASLPRPGRPPLEPPDLGPPAAGQTVEVPAGLVLLGSWPGAPGRDSAKEVDLVPTRVPAFAIDRLPYPDDPAQPPVTNVTRAEAERLCAAAGKRLCTEVEWEYACKGPQSQTWPYGDDYDPGRYGGGPERLASSFGVLGMGAMYEWTAGDWKDPRGTAVPNIAPARGAHPEEGDAWTRRCAMRTGLDPTRGSPRLGFRCCSGPGYPLPYEVEPVRRAVRPAPLLNDAMLTRLVRLVPELWRVHEAPRIQAEDVLTRALLRSNRTEASGVGFSISIQPLYWIPRQGDELLVIAGRSGDDVFTAALYTTGLPDVYVHAASLVLTGVGPDGGIALFGGLRDRKLLGWGECDDCREGGSYELQDDGTIRIGHRW